MDIFFLFLSCLVFVFFFFSSRRRHTRYIGDWSSDVCSSDLSSPQPSCMQDGWGEDWPLTYEELAPYYDKVEALIGVAGRSEERRVGKECRSRWWPEH